MWSPKFYVISWPICICIINLCDIVINEVIYIELLSHLGVIVRNGKIGPDHGSFQAIPFDGVTLVDFAALGNYIPFGSTPMP